VEFGSCACSAGRYIIVSTTNRISAIIAKTAKTLGLEVPTMLLAGADN
jgi:hypothetical protein